MDASGLSRSKYLRKTYKDIPIEIHNPLFPDRLRWEPMLRVRLGYRTAQSFRFYAYVDSGSPFCLFKWGLAKYLGISPTKGEFSERVGGVLHGKSERIYFHKVKLIIEPEWVVEVHAGFCRHLNATGILGRIGFFDNFKVTFDHSQHPPAFEIEKIARPN